MQLIAKDMADFMCFVDCVTNPENGAKYQVDVTMDKVQFEACKGLGLDQAKLNELFHKVTVVDTPSELITCDIIQVPGEIILDAEVPITDYSVTVDGGVL